MEHTLDIIRKGAMQHRIHRFISTGPLSVETYLNPPDHDHDLYDFGISGDALRIICTQG